MRVGESDSKRDREREGRREIVKTIRYGNREKEQ